MASYEDFLKSVQSQVDALKKQANQLANKEKSLINAQYDKAIQLQEQAVAQQQQAVQKNYEALFDANVVNEMVARKNAEEAIANMGLKDSGLNQTNQTAISISRGNADAATRLQRQAEVDALSATLAQYKAESDLARSEAIAQVELKNAETVAGIEQKGAETILNATVSATEFDQERYDRNYKYALDFNNNPNNIKYGFEMQVDSLGNLIKVPTVVTEDEDNNPLGNAQIYIGKTTGERNNAIQMFALYGNETPSKKKEIIKNTLLGQGGLSSMTDTELYYWIAQQFPETDSTGAPLLATEIVMALDLKAPPQTWSAPAPWGVGTTAYNPDGTMRYNPYLTIK